METLSFNLIKRLCLRADEGQSTWLVCVLLLVKEESVSDALVNLHSERKIITAHLVRVIKHRRGDTQLVSHLILWIISQKSPTCVM